MTHEQKELAIRAITQEGTMKAGASAAGISVHTLNEEMRKSAIFKRRILEAREEGKRNIADNAIDRIREYAFNPPPKTDRNVLTAAISLANAFEPGFRGVSQVAGKIEHEVYFKSAVPRPLVKRPLVEITKLEAKLLDNPQKPMVKSIKNVKNAKKEIKDDAGNLVGIQTVAESLVEEAIEGEVVNDNRNN